MDQPYRMTTRNRRTGAEHVLSGLIPSATWQLSLDFAREMEAAKTTRLLAEGCDFEWTLHFDQTGLRSEARLPPADELAALLHRLRPVILKKERTSFTNVLGALERAIPEPAFHACVEPLRNLFHGKDLRSQLRIEVDDHLVNSEACLDHYLNSSEYHRDLERAVHLEKTLGVHGLATFRPLFIAMILDKANAAMGLASMIEGFRKRDGRNLDGYGNRRA